MFEIGLEQIEVGNIPPFIREDNVDYLALVGSHSYGGATVDSDYDFYGFIVPPVDYIFPHLSGYIPGFGASPPAFNQWEVQNVQLFYGKADITIYSIVKYFQLVMDGNPNMIHSLFVPDNCVMRSSDVGKLVSANKHMFLSQKVYHTFRGMAYSHLHRLESRQRVPGSKRSKIIEKYGFDTKDASYCIRLIKELHDILKTGNLQIDKYGELILDIRNGKYSLTEIMEMWADENSKVEILYCTEESLPVPYKPHERKIRNLLMQCLELVGFDYKKAGFNQLIAVIDDMD